MNYTGSSNRRPRVKQRQTPPHPQTPRPRRKSCTSTSSKAPASTKKRGEEWFSEGQSADGSTTATTARTTRAPPPRKSRTLSQGQIAAIRRTYQNEAAASHGFVNAPSRRGTVP